MNYAATRERLRGYRDRIAELRKEMRETQAAVEPEAVAPEDQMAEAAPAASETVAVAEADPEATPEVTPEPAPAPAEPAKKPPTTG